MTTPSLDLSTLPPGVSATFTSTCIYGCTVRTVDGVEQPHNCDGVSVLLDAWRAMRDDATFGQAAERFAEVLKPLLRERSYDVWKDGVEAGRRGLVYGVDPGDDVEARRRLIPLLGETLTRLTNEQEAAAPAAVEPLVEPGLVALAWHDVTCPEGDDCGERPLHAAAAPLANTGTLARFLVRLGELR
jgi:hypothetical protein